MHIKDDCRILKKMAKLAREEDYQEHGALILCNILEREDDKIYEFIDECMLEEIGGMELKNNVRIPAKLSYIFLQRCKRSGSIPAVIHTHGKTYLNGKKRNASFSLTDMRFMERFAFCAGKMGDIAECLFIVTDGESVEYCLWEISTMQYTFKEEVLSRDA